MKIGYCTWGMPTVPIDTIVPFLAEVGYDGIEPTVIPGYSIELYAMDKAERRRVLQLINDHGLEMPTIAGHTPMLATDPDEAARNFQRLKDTVDLCVEWAQGPTPPALDTTAGGKPEEYEQLKPLLIERIGQLVEYGASQGVVIAMEPHFATSISTPERMLELMDAIRSPYLKVNFDISHFNIQGYSIAQSVAMMAPVSVHTHIKDERGQVPNFDFLIPGEGEFDYVTYLQEMDKAGYGGHITPEISIFVQRRPNYDPLEAARQSYRVLEQAFKDAGIART
jgi:sugar phosphate isomerase/epimerase